MIQFLKFYADWCGPCKVFALTVKQLADEHPEVEFINVDTEARAEYAAQHEVMSIPTVIIFKDDKEVFRRTGIIPKQVLERELEKLK